METSIVYGHREGDAFWGSGGDKDDQEGEEEVDRDLSHFGGAGVLIDWTRPDAPDRAEKRD